MSIKLLLADDSITIQKVIGIIFGGEDYALTVVDNGKAAIEKAREICPDVLLIDALMPGMTGYEVCEAVRATPALATKPILILTGSFEPFDEDKAKKCGADDYLAKPFESQQIINKVKELAELGASRAAMPVSPQPITSLETTADFTAPTEIIAVPVSPPPPEVSQPSEPSDIWGAFTSEPATVDTDDTDATVATALTDNGFSDSFDPDIFSIVTDISESQLAQPDSAPSLSNQHTGTKWIPVEEHTFEFEEEKIAGIPKTVFPEQKAPVSSSGFGEIVLENDSQTMQTPDAPANLDSSASDFFAEEPEIGLSTEPVPSFEPPIAAFETPITAFETPASDFVSPTAAFSEPEATPTDLPIPVSAATAALSEEQLKAAISAASKEVIERIVWEVVPDLAEALIREAIRKIKEGV